MFVIEEFEKAGILEAVKSVQDIYARRRNPFEDRWRNQDINYLLFIFVL